MNAKRHPFLKFLRLALQCAALVLAGGPGFSNGQSAPAILNAPPLIPTPKQARYEPAHLILPPGLHIIADPSCPARVDEIAGILKEELMTSTGLRATIEHRSGSGLAGAIVLQLAPSRAEGPEAYTLKISDRVLVTASDPRGLLWGVQTLIQAIDLGSTTGGPRLPCGEIADSPSRPWRGLMLDSVRSFQDIAFVQRTIRAMSAYKLNILHLHLADDEAWRFESKAWPKLNRPGESFYSQEELRALVKYARRFGIEIIPEFDLPGHSMTAVNAYPELDCEHRHRMENDAILCSGRAFTWEFIDRLVAEAATVFDSQYIHLGGDETYAISRWAACPDCQARMKEKGVADLKGYYNSFINDLDEIAKRHGKKLMVWNDAVHPNAQPAVNKDILIDLWIGKDQGAVAAIAAAGYTLVNSTSNPLYLTAFGFRDARPPEPLANILEWDAAHFPSPRKPGGSLQLNYWPLSTRATVLGGMASEWATEQGLVEQRFYPRLPAVAERLWAEGTPPKPADFETRYRAGEATRLRLLGPAPDDTIAAEALFDGSDLNHWQPLQAAKFIATSDVLHSETAWLESKRSYTDFILSFDLQTPAPTEATGVYIRCSPRPDAGGVPDGRAIRGAPPPDRIMSRDLTGLKGWNHFEVVARGRTISLTINGGLAWSISDSTPRSGPIVLRGEGAEFSYRNVVVRPLR